MLLAVSPHKTDGGLANRDILIRSSQQYFNKKTAQSEEIIKPILSATQLNLRPADNITKCWLLFSRSMSNTIKDKQLFILYCIQQILSMFIGAFIWWNMTRDYSGVSDESRGNLKNRFGSFFFILTGIYIAALFNSSLKMGQEASIVYKEIRGGLYDPWVYYWTKSFIDLIILVPVICVVSTGVAIH